MAEFLVQIQPERVASFRESAIELLCATPAFAALIRDAKTQRYSLGRA
jgi:hypothetical protein